MRLNSHALRRKGPKDRRAAARDRQQDHHGEPAGRRRSSSHHSPIVGRSLGISNSAAQYGPTRAKAAWATSSPKDVDPPSDAPVAALGRLYGRLDGGAGGGSGPALRLEASGGRSPGDLDGHVAAGADRGARGVRTSSSTSAGRPPGPPGGAAAEAGRSGGRAPEAPASRLPEGPPRCFLSEPIRAGAWPLVWVSGVVVSACVANERLRHGG